jgi:chemotaxis-related protein WspB
MLFLLFQLESECFAIKASRVLEVLPLLEVKALPLAPRGVAGCFNYHGQPVPALDLSEILLGRPAVARLSTRILLVQHEGPGRQRHLVGLIAEQATEILHRNPEDFVDSGIRIDDAPFLGPTLVDGSRCIHWLLDQHLVPERLSERLFPQPAPGPT